MSKSYFGRAGYNRASKFDSKVKEWADLFDKQGQVIEIYPFVQHVQYNKIQKQRQSILDDFNDTVDWIKSHLQPKYHNMVKLVGFHAQIRTPNQNDGGEPLERGIVDVNGKIIIDKDPIINS